MRYPCARGAEAAQETGPLIRARSRVAQLAERPAVNRQVPSSSLGAGAESPGQSRFGSDQLILKSR